MIQGNNPTAGIIIIGDEILSGQVKDENVKFLTTELGKLGIITECAIVIPDKAAEIIDTVQRFSKKYDYVFTTGGIGPTHDDITIEAIAQAFGLEMELNLEAVSLLEEYYGHAVSESNKKMAYMPAGIELIHNDVSKAPGFILHNIYVMAGIPVIVESMFSHIRSRLRRGVVINSTEVVTHLVEEEFAVELGHLQNKYQNVSIGSYPSVHIDMPGTMVVFRSPIAAEMEAARREFEAIIASLEGGDIKERA
jgi:molybdenum cofactor synthesis domain-containing protein